MDMRTGGDMRPASGLLGVVEGVDKTRLPLVVLLVAEERDFGVAKHSHVGPHEASDGLAEDAEGSVEAQAQDEGLDGFRFGEMPKAGGQFAVASAGARDCLNLLFPEGDLAGPVKDDNLHVEEKDFGWGLPEHILAGLAYWRHGCEEKGEEGRGREVGGGLVVAAWGWGGEARGNPPVGVSGEVVEGTGHGGAVAAA